MTPYSELSLSSDLLPTRSAWWCFQCTILLFLLILLCLGYLFAASSVFTRHCFGDSVSGTWCMSEHFSVNPLLHFWSIKLRSQNFLSGVPNTGNHLTAGYFYSGILKYLRTVVPNLGSPKEQSRALRL